MQIYTYKLIIVFFLFLYCLTCSGVCFSIDIGSLKVYLIPVLCLKKELMPYVYNKEYIEVII